jgi:hypothetical protein
MVAPLRFLGCVVTLTAMLAPWASVAANAVHLTLDDHHDEAAATHDDLHDADAVLHGHGHADGTPAHGHDATMALAPSQVPAPSLAIHPSIAASASPAFDVDAVVLHRLDPSPPQRVPIILRI